jgi:hypothetical protein
MKEDENIGAYVLLLDGIMNATKKLGEEVDESIIFQNILKLLTSFHTFID